MSASFPSPVDLPLPDAQPAELAALASSLAGAAFHAGVLDAHLSGPAASAPGWLGADSTAAAAQVGRTAALTREMCDALTSAWHRLDAHHHLLVTAIGRIRAIQAAQHEDFADAYGRVAVLEQQNGSYGVPDAAIPILEELRASDHRRAQRHAEVLDEVARDAADTARVLAGSSEVVGGTGCPDGGGRVLAYLAHQLPGWGDAELASLRAEGAELGGQLSHVSPETVAALLEEHRAVLTAPAFAAAFVAAAGPDLLRRWVQWAGLAVRADQLPVMLADLMGAADSVAPADGALRRTLEAPLEGPVDAATAVGLGRIVGAAGFSAEYRAETVVRLVAQEQAHPSLRRDELYVAPGEDPLASAVSALTSSADPDVAAGVVARPGIWGGLLGRVWTQGTSPLEQLVMLAVGSEERGSDAVRAVLSGVGGVADLISGPWAGGCPETGNVLAISPAVAGLVAAHLDAVTAPVVAAEGAPGVPREPLDDAALRQLSGLGLITQDLRARNTVMEALVQRMKTGLPDPAPGQPAPAAFATGGLFAAMAFGEREGIRKGLYTATERAAADAAAWNVLATALSFLPGSGALARVRDAATTTMSFVGPGGVPIETFFAQPQTGAFQASFAAVAATVPGLVKNGDLPDPGAALDHGLGTSNALAYEASLTPAQRDLWDRVKDGADEGYLTVGDGLGILPGSGAGR